MDGGPSMAKRPCCSDPSVAKTQSTMLSESDNDAVLKSFLGVFDYDTINTSYDNLIESRSSDSDENDLIQRALHLDSLLLEAGKRSDRKRSSSHKVAVWPLPPDLTIKVFGMLDTQSDCYAAATCSFFQKCVVDPLCFINIDLITLVPKVNNVVGSSWKCTSLIVLGTKNDPDKEKSHLF
ncbi:F-box protein SKIP17 [Lactuca sativa]|uniref:F-box protein SKIP17 n=1 Tax=Lactuca sativa TaxID=4236 RepID=UPI001C68ACD7|nr:F-box protein SKIP17 [Lactuca sativa]